MKIFIDIGHPAHVHYFKNFIKIMQKKGHSFCITARDKECVFELLNENGLEFHSRGTGKKSAFGKIIYMFKADYILYRKAKKFNPDVFLSFASPYAAQTSFLLRKPHITFDDTDHLSIARKFYLNFSTKVFTPYCFTKDIGPKQEKFHAFMELCYLLPKYFTPNENTLQSLSTKKGDKYAIVRFVSWDANHDYGVNGLPIKEKLQIIKKLEENYKVLISSEGELPIDLMPYKINLPPSKIHDILSFASIVVSEGATMTSECAMLGTPVIYINPLNAGTLNEQEKYGLIFIYKDLSDVINKIDLISKDPDYKVKNLERRNRMLSEMIDPTQLMVEYFSNFNIKNNNNVILKKRFLFYLVHPAKYQFHKVQINALKAKGHTVDIVINTKDILEDLLKEEGWEYTNIFPKSRKIKGVHVYIAAVISIFLTVYRLWKFTRGKKYDVFIGDLLSIVGRLKGVTAFYATDDVLAAVPEQAIFFKTVRYIIAPFVTDIGKYKTKKIAYKGYKALAHLHPNHFKADETRLSKELQGGKPYFLIRCTGFGATHDIGKSGISNEVLTKLIPILEPHGQILITSERELPDNLKKYNLKIRKNDITHYINYAQIFIGDSTTMCTEAAVLGTAAVEFDEYFYEIEQMLEIEREYQLIHCFRTNQITEFLAKITELVNTKDLKKIYGQRRQKLLNDTIDVSSFLTWLFENDPKSVQEYFENPEIINNKYRNYTTDNSQLKTLPLNVRYV
jgi:predicted glycosyltransferase